MEINKYLKEMKRTLPDNLSYREKILNMTLGICGESGEVYNIINTLKNELPNIPLSTLLKNSFQLQKELGDLLWYLFNLHEIFEMQDVEEYINNKINSYPRYDNSLVITLECNKLNRLILDFADYVKKFIFHGHDNKEMESKLKEIISTTIGLMVLCGLNYETILEINIEKLKKRYPNKFSKEESINRGDKWIIYKNIEY